MSLLNELYEGSEWESTLIWLVRMYNGKEKQTFNKV